MAKVACIDTLMVRRNPARGRKVRVLKEQLRFWKKKGPRLCISKFSAEEVCPAESWANEIERFGGTRYKIKGTGASLPKTEERMFVVDSGASMHMLSKKDLSSDAMDTLRRSRNPTTVVTANGEVQTNEEAQVYVHDIDLFVTVQLLEETPAVQSLGKLCSEHGCSHEWKNGETPRLTKNGKTITCTTDNFVPLVVPGLSSSSSSSSSASTPGPKDQSKSSGESEASTDPMTTRRAKQHARNRCRQTLICKPREAVVQHTQKRDGRSGSNARHSWLLTALRRKCRGPGDACART